ncbi:MAG: 5-Enolpyruvylshikimate-3-phosphate synthase [Oscillospiraceae bacterium]|nr:5-Enolpyruvylshikimate-3-phosphate synthase [Oscillospiraceae bacterium]
MELVLTPTILTGAVTPPPSKSQAHRVYIASCLAGGGSVLHHLPESKDMDATRRCMAALLAGKGRCTPCCDAPELDCGESGSTLRFLIPLALALRGGGIFTGQGRLMERPQEPYARLFEEKGIFFSQRGGVLSVFGRLEPGVYSIAGDVSSQFITGLLFALPLLEGDSELRLTTPLESAGYVDMTLDALRQFGVTVAWDGDRTFAVSGGQTYRPASVTIEADYSQAGFFYAANGIGNSVELCGLNPDSCQGDRMIVDYAEKLREPGIVILDVSQCPDLVPALAVYAALRTGEETVIANATRLRIKESDRLEAVTAELYKLGADIRQGADFLQIHGVSSLRGGAVDAHNDHRIAMMLAIASTRTDGEVILRGAESVEKSYPSFWSDFQALGGRIKEL